MRYVRYHSVAMVMNHCPRRLYFELQAQMRNDDQDVKVYNGQSDREEELIMFYLEYCEVQPQLEIWHDYLSDEKKPIRMSDMQQYSPHRCIEWTGTKYVLYGCYKRPMYLHYPFVLQNDGERFYNTLPVIST